VGQLDTDDAAATSPYCVKRVHDDYGSPVNCTVYLATRLHLNVGQFWYWPLPLVQNDVNGENARIQNENKKRKAEQNKKLREQRAAEKAAAEERRRAEEPGRKRAAYVHNQNFLPSSATAQLQAKNKGTRTRPGAQ
jgi:hypothetical protein